MSLHFWSRVFGWTLAFGIGRFISWTPFPYEPIGWITLAVAYCIIVIELDQRRSTDAPR